MVKESWIHCLADIVLTTSQILPTVTNDFLFHFLLCYDWCLRKRKAVTEGKMAAVVKR